jgi:hypothetical protein
MADDDYSSVPDQHVAAARPDGWSLRQAVDCCLEVARKHTAAISLELGQEPAEDPPSH